jgi:hypothetical protein
MYVMSGLENWNSRKMPFDQYVRQPEPTRKIWRYMSFEKFMYLLHRQTLFFPQAKKFEDPFEGFYSSLAETSPETELFVNLKTIQNIPNGPSAYCAITCWHVNDYESTAMWGQYANQGRGIAIQSTVKKLIENLDFSDVKNVYTGMVSYQRAEDPPPGDPDGRPQIYDYFCKRESFVHENEFRILCLLKNWDQANKDGGIDIPIINLNELIEKVYISPKSERWLAELIREIVREKYSLWAEIIQSDLYRHPFV